MKVDASGNKTGTLQFPGIHDNEITGVVQSFDSGCVVAGSTTSYGNGLEDAFVMKTDSLGHPKWSKTFGGAGSDEALGVISREDGSYIVAGNMRPFSTDSAAMVYQLNNSGDSVWSARLQGFVSHEGTSLQKSGNNSFTLCY